MTANFNLSIFGLTICKHVQASIWSNLIQFQGRKLVAVGTLQQVFMLGQLQPNTGHYRINFAQVFLHCVFEIFSTELQGLLNKTAIHCCTSIPHSCDSPGSISFLCYLGFYSSVMGWRWTVMREWSRISAPSRKEWKVWKGTCQISYSAKLSLMCSSQPI